MIRVIRGLSAHFEGQVFKRETECCYKFVLIGKKDQEAEWIDISWHYTISLARASMQRWEKLYPLCRVIPVTSNEYIRRT
jgi:hypothetical protein